VNATRGVGRLVSFGASPSALPAELVAGLRARCDNAGVLVELDTLGVGDRVRLLSGPFADYVACVEALDEGQRLWAVLEAARNPTRVSILASEVEPAGHLE
jgi:transcriptional antiterminator RfaH